MSKEDAKERRACIVELLRRKELMGASDIGAQLGIAKHLLMSDLRTLQTDGAIAREGIAKSPSSKWRLASKTRKAASTNGNNGHAKKEERKDAAPPR